MTPPKKSEPVIDSTAEELPDEQPTGSQLVSLDDAPENILAVVDRHDEALIVSELQRRALKVMLYAFPLEGHQVVDLSYLGVNEAVRLMNNSGKWQITVDPASLVVDDVTEDLGDGPEPCYCATVYAVNKLTGYGQFGTYTQAKRLKLTDANKIARRRSSAPDSIDEHDRIADKFSRQKAVNKAQRNSLRIHIPEELRQQIIAQYRGQPDAVERIQIGAGVQGLADLPAPLTDDRAIAQRETARALYDEIRKVDPAAVLPGQYHTYLSRAEHDHERLDDFVAYLNGKLEELKAAKDA